MKFEYLDVVQRTPDWFRVRMGRVTASRLSDWLATSVAKGKEGTPLKPRLDYERELWFERQFAVNFNNYISPQMLDGQDFEDFARKQYEVIKGVRVARCGVWYSEEFAATPDGIVSNTGGIGIVEIKILRDNKFTEVLLGGVPDDHYKQIQGQLWASGAVWCDYVAINLNTKKVAIWRVTPNTEFQAMLEESLKVPLSVEEVATTEIYDIQGEIPARETIGIELESANQSSWL